jgi:riboflavin synthase
MFTGLVETIGTWRRRTRRQGTMRALIETTLGRGAEPLVLGESIAVDGACLTVDHIVDSGFEADISTETLERTTLGSLTAGAKVHLERAMPLGGRMGGHTVLGHVDGVGRVTAREPVGDTIRLTVAAPSELARFLAPKGSVALHGVSLTLNDVRGSGDRSGVSFEVMLVPHTLRRTNLAERMPGAMLNIEVDVLARYVARDLEFSGAPRHSTGQGPGGETDEPHVDDDERLLGKLRAFGWA